jgi:hypothetical protein
MTILRTTALVAITGLCLSLGACAHDSGSVASNTTLPQPDQNRGAFGGLFGGHSKETTYNAQTGIGVNAYLWRASLDTISFMPLASADPWGGVIISDWYANPQKPDERFKTTVYILDSRLRADALNVSVYKQNLVNGQWVDADVSEQTQIDIENAILTRARELHLSDVKK